MQREIRGKVIGKRAGGGSLHQAAARSAVSKDCEGLLEIQAPSADHIFCFGERGSLNSAHEIVDELHQGAAFGRAEMNEFAPQYRQNRLGGGESGLRSSDQER